MAYWLVRLVTHADYPYKYREVNVYAEGALEAGDKVLETTEGGGVYWTVLEAQLDEPPKPEGMDVKLRKMGAPMLPGLSKCES